MHIILFITNFYFFHPHHFIYYKFFIFPSISFYLLQIFTFSIHIMFSLIQPDANDPQGLMHR